MKKLLLLLASIAITLGEITYNLPIVWDVPELNTNTYFKVWINTNDTFFKLKYVTDINTETLIDLPVNVTNLIYVTTAFRNSTNDSVPSNVLTNIVRIPEAPFNLQLNGPITINIK